MCAQSLALLSTSRANCRLLFGPHSMHGPLALPSTAVGGCWVRDWAFRESAMVWRMSAHRLAANCNRGLSVRARPRRADIGRRLFHGEFVKLRCDWHLEQPVAIVPPRVMAKDGMGGQRLARSFCRNAAAERLVNAIFVVPPAPLRFYGDLRIRHGQRIARHRRCADLVGAEITGDSDAVRPADGSRRSARKVSKVSGVQAGSTPSSHCRTCGSRRKSSATLASRPRRSAVKKTGGHPATPAVSTTVVGRRRCGRRSRRPSSARPARPASCLA
jgi:hypothetical protein